MNFLQFNRQFPTELKCIEHFIKIRYGEKIVCPVCGKSHNVYHTPSRPKNAYCNHCQFNFSIFKNTIFEKSDTDLRIWFYAVMQLLNGKKGISALQLQRDTGITYKTAWRILHQIRKAMGHTENDKIFDAIVEIDETYIGGKPRKGNNDGEPTKRGRGTRKTPIVGVKHRTSKAVYATIAMPDKNGKKLTGRQLFKILDKVCQPNTAVMTDDFGGYNFLDRNRDYIHLRVNHSMGQYSAGNGVHTNGIESFWALLKRGIYGMYHKVSLKYMQRYIDEFCWRFNNNFNDNKFDSLLSICVVK